MYVADVSQLPCATFPSMQRPQQAPSPRGLRAVFWFVILVYITICLSAYICILVNINHHARMHGNTHIYAQIFVCHVLLHNKHTTLVPERMHPQSRSASLYSGLKVNASSRAKHHHSRCCLSSIMCHVIHARTHAHTHTRTYLQIYSKPENNVLVSEPAHASIVEQGLCIFGVQAYASLHQSFRICNVFFLVIQK